jgi:hypothetical protein
MLESRPWVLSTLNDLNKAIGPEGYKKEVTKTRSGNEMHLWFMLYGSRYPFDEVLCRDGWIQFNTDQDASYFGVWVHYAKQQTVTYCEGDISLVICKTPEEYDQEIKEMESFYEVTME